MRLERNKNDLEDKMREFEQKIRASSNRLEGNKWLKLELYFDMLSFKLYL